eukprot:TRINITY_DN4242_c0_g1_i1.p1 TRINITY_DN4242_c0_g1~~TRINITY_DN4242_c0_g1_i1.p1  ORF type:complete len:128 (+),score=21.79 TRINITY_DN4242_c0_g1_i1:93-476(+)
MDEREPEAERNLLAKHETKATFEGVIERPCMHMTSLCPDRCSHTKKRAQFSIDEYTNYESHSQYGQKTKAFAVALDGSEAEKDGKVLSTIESLSNGDKVALHWNHDYITTTGGSKYPQRPVTLLNKL